MIKANRKLKLKVRATDTGKNSARCGESIGQRLAKECGKRKQKRTNKTNKEDSIKVKKPIPVTGRAGL
jgi:hypothetical protein